MKKILLSALLLICATNIVIAQQKKKRPVDQFADFTLAIGSSQVTAAGSYIYNWKFGKRKKFETGFGLRFSSYFGRNLYFKTAPARLTSGKTGPGVFFADDILPNIDSVLFPKAQMNALNLSVNFGYNFTKRFSLGLNIDVIGFSFGKKQSGVYYANNFAAGVPVSAKPTGFNIFLVSDNDRGVLNSEFFAKYKWNDSWGIKLALGFLFAEYTTDTQVQTTPASDKNDRFRKKMAGGGIGITYNFKK